MENINVSIRNIRTQKHCLAKAKKSSVHSVGNRSEIGNPIDELSEKNRLWVLGEEMKNGDEAKSKVENYMDNLKPDVQYSNDDVLDRTHQKKKVRKWIDAARTNDEEKEVFNNVMDRLENKQDIEDDLITDFKKIDSKISRRNDKVKALESLQTSHNKINNSAKKGSQLDVLTVEKVFKITHKSDFEMTSKDQREMQQEFHEKHFPDYPIIYMAEHNDEGKPHCHLMHSGKNSRTGKFDYPDAEAKVVQNRMKEKGIVSTAMGKKWADYNEEELKQHGEIWQDMNYEMGNKKLNQLGIKNRQFKKLEGEEKRLANERMTNDPMAKKAITNRNYNNARLNEIKANKSGQIVKDNQLKIDGQQQEIEKNDETITEQKSILGRFKDEYKKFIQAGRKFIDKALNNSPEKDLNETAQKTAKHAHSAIQAQPKIKTEVSNNINKITQKSGSDKVEKAFSGGGGSGGSKSGGKCSVCNALPPMQSGICAVCYSRSQSGKENSESEPEQKSRPRLL